MKPTPPGWPRMSQSVYYQDPAAAIDWLCDAFGFRARNSGVRVSRAWHHFGLVEQNRPQLAEKMERGYDALRVMEGHLATRRFFVAERYSIADIGLYAYTHVAHEGGFDLAAFPAVRAWLARVAAQPRHVPITRG